MRHAILCLLLAAAGAGPAAGAPASATLDEAVPSGRNFSDAAFRLWMPAGLERAGGIVALVPGSNSDGRPQVGEPFWRDFATRHGLALVGCFFTDHRHENMDIEDYARAGDGSGAALLEALGRFGATSGHPELSSAPLYLWGISAGGEFNYEFACWMPGRVAAFVVNKGGYYFTHLAPAATRRVPGIFFVGDSDAEFRRRSIEGIYAVNKQAGARWKLVVERGVAHEVGQSRDRAARFFEGVLAGSQDGR